jgi:hypothetical protein
LSRWAAGGAACAGEADYPFSATGRLVRNRIGAHFVLCDGLIVEHLDTFDLWIWGRMALGPIGWRMGWTSRFRDKLRAKARKGLIRFMESRPEYR